MLSRFMFVSQSAQLKIDPVADFIPKLHEVWARLQKCEFFSKYSWVLFFTLVPLVYIYVYKYMHGVRFGNVKMTNNRRKQSVKICIICMNLKLEISKTSNFISGYRLPFCIQKKKILIFQNNFASLPYPILSCHFILFIRTFPSPRSFSFFFIQQFSFSSFPRARSVCRAISTKLVVWQRSKVGLWRTKSSSRASFLSTTYVLRKLISRNHKRLSTFLTILSKYRSFTFHRRILETTRGNQVFLHNNCDAKTSFSRGWIFGNSIHPVRMVN